MLSKIHKNFIAVFFIIPLALYSQDNLLVDLNNFYPQKIETAGFTLHENQTIKIDVSALTGFSRYRPVNGAWIINNASREIIWKLEQAEDIDRNGSVLIYTDDINLPEGNYEVYYSTYRNNSSRWYGHRPGFFERLFGRGFDDDHPHYDRRDYKDLYMKIEGVGEARQGNQIIQWQNDRKNTALIDFTKMSDDDYKSKIIEINKPVKLKLYALGEVLPDGEYDFGWIVNLADRQKVWELSFRNSDYAGGAQKNRLTTETLSLDPGKYKIVYVTDDSHSYEKWNSAPPYDPEFWGLTVWLENESERGNLIISEEQETTDANLIVNFSRVKDREFLSHAFTLQKELTLNIHALGEGEDGEMYDYGWIVDLKSGKRIWEMTYRNTDRAGGASKNRIFDGTILLPPGNYRAYYISDGSHSYRRWNAGRPYEEESWGMRISVADEHFNAGDVTDYNGPQDESILVGINRVGDYDKVRATFTLEKPQSVHIYCVGEGVSNRMFDYAWIENMNTGETVWKMKYNETERAGGARKNRLFEGDINLAAGDYEVFYKTDDSHSYADWNDNPPDDPVSWGVTITRLEE